MNEKDLKSMIEQILLEMVGDKPEEAAQPATKQEPEQHAVKAEPVSAEPVRHQVQQNTEEADSGECLDDITEIDLRKQLLVPEPEDREGYLKMKEKTPARLPKPTLPEPC